VLKARVENGTEVRLVPGIKSLKEGQRLETLVKSYMGARVPSGPAPRPPDEG
jgi:hypothetical protein